MSGKPKLIDTYFLDPAKTMANIAIELAEEKKATFSSLWEVQRRNTFIGGFTKYNEDFRIKNVATGLFLCQDQDSENLILTPNGNLDGCYFSFKLKAVDDSTGRIQYNDLLRIQSHSEMYLQYSENTVKGLHGNPVVICDQKPIDVTQLYFMLKLTSEAQSFTANRIGSLFPFLLQFYKFLQNWGLQATKSQQMDEFLIYDYNTALSTEKDLELEVNQLFESIENINDFLTEGSEVFSHTQRQNLLHEQKIIEMLLMIVQLIDSKIFGARFRKVDDRKADERSSDDRRDIGKLYRSKNIEITEELSNQDKTPQFIAYRHLRKIQKELYRTLEKCIQSNPLSSSIILKHDVFLSGQLAPYKTEVSSLIKEAIRNVAHLEENDINGDPVITIFVKVV